MAWPFFLPAEITFWALAALVVVATVAAYCFKRKPWRVFAFGLLLALVAFVPSCAAVMSVLDEYRFGVFNYSDFAAVGDLRVQRFLPEAAKDITVDKFAQGHRARFTIAKPALDIWFDRMWQEHGQYSRSDREEPSPLNPSEVQSFAITFGDLDWHASPDLIEYQSPSASNWAGFTLWYSPATGIAYERGGYW